MFEHELNLGHRLENACRREKVNVLCGTIIVKNYPRSLNQIQYKLAKLFNCVVADNFSATTLTDVFIVKLLCNFSKITKTGSYKETPIHKSNLFLILPSNFHFDIGATIRI